MKVLQVCAFAAEYSGNFIASLEALESELNRKNISVIYAFPQGAEEKEWCKTIQERTKVYFLPLAKARILPKTYQMFQQIYKENKDIKIIHSHFELYDMPATLMAPKGMKIFWHLHDSQTEGERLRKILWKLQYGIVGKRAYLLSVSEHYRENIIKMGFQEKRTTTVVNAINLDRFNTDYEFENRTYIYDFCTFGWDFYGKGVDLLLNACDRLEKNGYQFKLLLNGNYFTWKKLQEYLDGRTSGYLVKGNPVEDVNGLFEKTGVFILASRSETFSYAVCEAAYFGLPVISSRIPGLEWAKELPTVQFFEVENVDSLYEAMEAYLKGKKNTDFERQQTRKIIEQKYSMNVWVKQIMECYGV